jgi:hypothetical protein
VAEPIEFDVFAYSAETLAQVLSSKSVNEEETRQKRHFHYFVEYLGSAPTGGLVARTILMEWP